ncbi:MAG: shikimate kinase [Oscillospiraceae bacterium]|jgi:shikimate kinase|nr:shikimate kinase [Oscillospiraceae bacterium]
MKKSNITLIGMAGCGKSTVGVLLAKAKNLMFVDTDLIIQQKYGKYLWEILEEEGSEVFLCREEAAICRLQCEKTCIATGGSVVYSAKAMEHLKQLSTMVFLDVAFEEIERRIADIKTRGVVIAPGRTLRGLFDERRPLYQAYADLTVNATGRTAEEVVEATLQAVSEAEGEHW